MNATQKTNLQTRRNGRHVLRVLSKKPKLGSGARFKALKAKLAKKPGVTNPGALAASIGRRKYGAKKFSQLSAKGR